MEESDADVAQAVQMPDRHGRRPASPLVERVYRRILADIETGSFPVGRRLPGENELAARFLVSRPIVRDALQILRDDGVVYSRRGSGTYVHRAPLREVTGSGPAFAPVETVADIQRCYEFRLTIEPDHAYWAAKRWNDERLASVEAALHQMHAATLAHQHREDADFNFHAAIAEASNNHYYVTAILALREHVRVGMKFHGLSLKEPGTGLEHVLAEHASIFEAIRLRDADRARLLMRLHLEGSRDRVFGGRMLDLAY